MRVTVVVKCDGRSAGNYVAVIAQPLSEITKEQRNALRKAFDCDGFGRTVEDDDDASNMFFREVEVYGSIDQVVELFSVDGESDPVV